MTKADRSTTGAPGANAGPAAGFLTAKLPGTGGVLRESDADFVVEEVARDPPAGRGDFALALVEKRGLSTPELQRRLGAALGLPALAVGIAGFKDSDAIARQWVSVPWTKEPRLSTVAIKDVEVITIARHDRPLHPGDHAGNRFTVRIRGVDDEKTALVRAQAILAELEQRGVPNFYGTQRFGLRGESAEVGRLLLLGENLRALDLILGAPSPRELDPRAGAFRKAYERSAFREALGLVPGRLATERRLLELLSRGRDKHFVFGTLAPGARRFYLSAWQSLLFNRVLARRLDRFDPLPGDILMQEPPTGTIKPAGSPAVNPTVSPTGSPIGTPIGIPTGPLFGEHVPLADGEPGAIERAVLAESGVPVARLHRPSGLALHGERRALRFFASELTAVALTRERTLLLAFRLPPGCFATTLLAEVMKGPGPVV